MEEVIVVWQIPAHYHMDEGVAWAAAEKSAAAASAAVAASTTEGFYLAAAC
tara:strand:- start:320 stop:472 length:153 start_codon:yes stop_codon:yes gene_type:complete